MILPVSGRLTDAFGPRGYVPGLGDLGFHTGQDIAAASGTPIYAAHTGTVTRKWWDAYPNGAGAGGNMVEVRGDDGIYTRYAHMLRPANFEVGARVAEGRSILGYVGSSGAATGAHLHFESLKGGQFVNPMTFITNPEGDEDMTPDQSMKLDAIFAGIYGPKNVGAGELKWASLNGPQSAQFGNLEIDIYTQKLVAQLQGQVAALTEAVKLIPGGGNIDMAAIEEAAERGAKDALASMKISVEVQ